MPMPKILTTLISIKSPVLKRITNKSIQLSGLIPQPIELLLRKKSFTTPDGKKTPINWLRTDPEITPKKSTKNINEIDRF